MGIDALQNVWVRLSRRVLHVTAHQHQTKPCSLRSDADAGEQAFGGSEAAAAATAVDLASCTRLGNTYRTADVAAQ
jgi:hypothetical protein